MQPFTITVTPQSKKPPHDPIWNHPVLALLQQPKPDITHIAGVTDDVNNSKLYLVPTTFGDLFDNEFAPQPTPRSELPELEPWIKRLTISLIEIWGGRRSPTQISRWCHRMIYQEVLRKIGKFSSPLKMRKIYIREPIEGVAEVVVTLRCGERIRSLVMRIEGVDHRWLCTELFLI